MSARTLADLLAGVDPGTLPAGLDALAGRPVEGFAVDSRKVGPGTVFGAFQGALINGEQFIAQAIADGAIAIVARPQAYVPADQAVHIADPQPRQRFAELAGTWFAPYPATCAAVTGTNGKTSVADMLLQIWRATGASAASIGTLGVNAPACAMGLPPAPALTTPDVVTFLASASALQRSGVTHLVFEASSHGLHQHRVTGLPVEAAAFTNLSRDHLDYHGTMEAYFEAKMTLFDHQLMPGGHAVVWADDEWSDKVAARVRARGDVRLISIGRNGAELRLVSQRPVADGQDLAVQIGSAGERKLHLPLIGGYQAANALVAAGLALALGLPEADVFGAMERLAPVPGRLQLAGRNACGAPAFVDYAHTPDGLQAAIAALRPHTAGRLHVVFGCGGDRDRGKRPQMGEVATRMADDVYVTDDNPRSEDPAAIRAQIMAAAPGAREIGDRRAAIAHALQRAVNGDVVLIAGKGHETGQIIAGQTLPFDDVLVVEQLVDAVAGQVAS